MPQSKYKHVTRRARQDKPWQASVRGKHLGTFANEEQAAAAVAKKLQQPKNTLLRKTALKRIPKRTHRYIYWHNRAQAWQVKIGSAYLGVFGDHEDALQTVIKHKGLVREELRLCPNAVRRSLQGQRNAVELHISWFQGLYLAYSIPEVAYPGDLCDMDQRAMQGSSILAHPNFIVPMMLAKFGPHREALNDAFLITPKPSNDPLDLKWTYDVIVAALIVLSNVSTEVMDPWLAGPGRMSTHHSGLVVYAHCSLKIMTAVDDKPKCKKSRMESSGHHHLVFGKQERVFRILPFSDQLKNTLRKVRLFGEALLQVEPPKSLEEWSRAMTHMTSIIKTAPGIPKSTCYRYKWVVRGFWDYQRRVAGISPGITYVANATVLRGNIKAMICDIPMRQS